MPLDKKYRELFNLVEIEDVLAHRIYQFQVKIPDLFLCVKIPSDWYEIEYNLETKFGTLRCFFISDPDLKTNLLLHKDKFQYPTQGFLSSLRNLPTQKEKVEQEMSQAEKRIEEGEELLGNVGIN